jgi:hypothetical protein
LKPGGFIRKGRGLAKWLKWQSAHLASMKPRVKTPVPSKLKKKKKK